MIKLKFSKYLYVLFLLIWGSITLSSCTSNIQQVIYPTESKNFYSNLNYGTHPSQKLDIALPRDAGEIEQSLNVVLYIHGGGWKDGDKAVYFENIQSDAKNLMVIAASMNYRMIGNGASCDEMIDDISSAVSYIKRFADSFGFGCKKMMITGLSAGAHLALMYSYKKMKLLIYR